MRNNVLLSSGSLSNYGTDRVFQIARETGFDGVELIIDARADNADPRYLTILMERYGLPLPAIHTPFVFVDPPGWEKEEIPRIKRSVRLAEELGASILVLHTPFFTDRVYRRWLEEELDSFQETTAVVLGVENMPHCRKLGGRVGVWLKSPVRSEVSLNRFLRRLPSFLLPVGFPLSDPEKLLRFRHLVLDTTHLATGGFDPVSVYERVKEKVVHVHLSNFDGREHVELRQGKLDLAGFIRHLKESGYGGMLCLEIMPEYFPSEDETFTRRLLRDNLALIRENLA